MSDCNIVDRRPLHSSVHGIFKARILEWVSVSYSRGSSWLKDQTYVSCISCIGRLIPYHLSHLQSPVDAYSHLVRASLMAQRVKCLPAVQETWVQSLGWEIPWRRKWQPTPVLLPGKSRGWRSLVGYSPWGLEESDTTERLHFHFDHSVNMEYILLLNSMFSDLFCAFVQ